MTKKNNLALFTLFIVGLFSLFTINISAQNKVSTTTETSTKTCSGEKFVMPSSIAVGNDAFATYIKVASLSMDERKTAFRNLSNEDKAAFIKVNLALQFVKRPNMTKEQQEFVLYAISKVFADIWDKSDSEKIRRSQQLGLEIESKAFGLFGFKDAGDFVEPLNTNKEAEVAFLQKYENLLKSGMQLRKKLVKEIPIAERVEIWKTQLAYHLATSSFNNNQKEFIVEIMPNIQAILEASSNLSKDEKTKYVEVLESSMFKVFTKAEAFAIFMEVGIQKFVKDDAETTNLLQATCNCRWYCSSGGDSCNDNYCNRVDRCGPFDSWECYSRCSRG